MSEKVVRIHEDKQIPTGSGGGSMEVRVTRLESDVSHLGSDIAEIKTDLREIKSDLKKLPYWFITTIITLAAFMAGLVYFVNASNQQFMSILVSALK